ncbi:hypothetical protein Pla110_22940 [Polystyrenella longa]|uniref:DUF1571 domain-containing protein n=1 Tax=Polystyrenella longa TaxID=2528007 RepID=A0A518CMX6_9PLAN|nr:DUF1571 domain-containing protein [Polystyrenella longa]QDU80563.1 hypothetical protein Pla110_22940 [Polystyrenella longa]
MSCSDCQKKKDSFTRHNLLAGIFAVSGIAVLYVNFDPVPRGHDPAAAQLEEVDLSEFTSFTNVSSGFMKKVQAEEFDEPQNSLGKQPIQTAMIAEPVASSSNDVLHSSAEAGSALSQLKTCQGEDAVKLIQSILEEGLENLKQIPDYTTTFIKQERIAGSMTEPNLINLKIRHEPFSVYMKWLNGDKGRELLYVDGENNGDMVVRVGGVRGRFLPALNLNPLGDLALQESRHPITQIGLANLIRKALEFRERDLNNLDNLNCWINDGVTFDKRDCFEFVVEYQEKRPIHEYRKSVITIEKSLGIPVGVKNFAWEEQVDSVDANNLDKSTLIENYAYTNINYTRRLAAAEFDKSNQNYRFIK